MAEVKRKRLPIMILLPQPPSGPSDTSDTTPPSRDSVPARLFAAQEGTQAIQACPRQLYCSSQRHLIKFDSQRLCAQTQTSNPSGQGSRAIFSDNVEERNAGLSAAFALKEHSEQGRCIPGRVRRTSFSRARCPSFPSLETRSQPRRLVERPIAGARAPSALARRAS